MDHAAVRVLKRLLWWDDTFLNGWFVEGGACLLRFCWILLLTMRSGCLLVGRLLRNRQHKSREEIFGEELHVLLQSLGPTWIKLGQLLASRPDVFPPAITAHLSLLQDQVPPFPPEALPEVLQRVLPRAAEDIFFAFSPTPVASGSIAQVHRAILRDTKQVVAVKLRRPGVDRLIHRDLLLCVGALRILSQFPALRRLPMEGVFSEIKDALEGQLDFGLEADFNRCLQEIFSEDSEISIPRLFDEWCGEEILVMEFMEDLIKFSESADEVRMASSVQIGLRALYRMLFTFGTVHCDLHAGNIFVRGSGGIVLLDTGFMNQMTLEKREQFRSFFWSITFNQGSSCAQILIDTASMQQEGFDKEAFVADITKLIDDTSRQTAENFQVARFASSLFTIQREHGLIGATEFTMAILSLLVFEGLAKRWCPELDFQQAAIPYFADMVSQSLST